MRKPTIIKPVQTPKQMPKQIGESIKLDAPHFLDLDSVYVNLYLYAVFDKDNTEDVKIFGTCALCENPIELLKITTIRTLESFLIKEPYGLVCNQCAESQRRIFESEQASRKNMDKLGI